MSKRVSKVCQKLWVVSCCWFMGAVRLTKETVQDGELERTVDIFLSPAISLHVLLLLIFSCYFFLRAC